MPPTQNEKQKLDIITGILANGLELTGSILKNSYLGPISLGLQTIYGFVDYKDLIPENASESKFNKDFEKVIKNSIKKTI